MDPIQVNGSYPSEWILSKQLDPIQGINQIQVEDPNRREWTQSKQMDLIQVIGYDPMDLNSSL